MKTGRMPIFFGCTGNNTSQTIANVTFAKNNGADGAILAAPAYICAPEADIEAFFLEVADATDLPLGIYNNPPRVKSDLHWDQLIRIFKHPNYVVHKESTGRVGQVAQVLAAKTGVAVMCCDSPNLGLVVPTMSLGGHGTANMTGNLAPSRTRDHLQALDQLCRSRRLPERLSRTAAAVALHLFGHQSGRGEIADESGRHAVRRSAQTAHGAGRRGARQGHPGDPGTGSRQEIRLSHQAAVGCCGLIGNGSRHSRSQGSADRREPWLGKACALALARRTSMSPIVARTPECWSAPAPEISAVSQAAVTWIAADMTSSKDAPMR